MLDLDVVSNGYGAVSVPQIQRYNVLLVIIRRSLEDLKKGIKGLVVMSSDLEEVFVCVLEGRVPPPWLKGQSF